MNTLLKGELFCSAAAPLLTSRHGSEKNDTILTGVLGYSNSFLVGNPLSVNRN
jgi:hypothetical protein